MDQYLLKFDGSCAPKNPGGTAAFGYILYYNNIVLDKGQGIIGTGEGMTNNVAEHVALYKGLNSFQLSCNYEIDTLEQPITLLIQGDSMLVINQMNNIWGARREKPYYPWYLKNKSATKTLKDYGVKITYQWIPREENQDCDDLSKMK